MAEPAPAELTPPVPLVETSIPYPEGAPIIGLPVTVKVRLSLDTEGKVFQVVLLEGAGPPFDEAVLLGATHFVFEPARYRGEPVAVEIDFSQEFVPPPVPLLDRPAPTTEPTGVLEGWLVEKGTGDAIPTALILAVTAEGRELRTESDADGRFRMRLPEGLVAVEVRAAGYKRFLVDETLGPDQALEVRYLLERLSYDPYESVIVGTRERTEVARTRLGGRELLRVPGTLGDPFRVIGTLPGVAQIMSLVSYPMVRGTSPGNTGFLLDGTPVPQLFHLFAGPAVVHPEFIDRVDFYPGNFPSRFGGYTGGIVDGVSRRARPDEERLDLEINTSPIAGVFVREPVESLGMTATAAGRYGYPALVLEALNSDLFLSYWDYQLRLDGGEDDRWTAFVFGSFDESGTTRNGVKEVSYRAQFHRVDLRFQTGDDEARDAFQLVLGNDQILGQSRAVVDPTIMTWSISPRFSARRQLGDSLAVEAGVEGGVQMYRGGVLPTAFDPASASLFDESPELYDGGVFVELPWDVTDDLRLTPGVRADVYHNSSATKTGVDPRLAFRLQLFDVPDGPLVLKGGVGWFHSPPRFLIPMPALESFALSRGLVASLQTSAGIEAPLSPDADLELVGFFNYMDPVVFDLAFNTVDLEGGIDEGASEATLLLLEQKIGRAYGLEARLRHRDVGPLFGWISYTLSRSERLRESGWVPFDFDRTHMVHVVAGVKLPRNWEMGTRVQVQSGRPVSNDLGYNAGRTPYFYRADLRIDKRAVWDSWLLDFYVDLINVTLAPEQLEREGESQLRVPILAVGVKASL